MIRIGNDFFEAKISKVGATIHSLKYNGVDMLMSYDNPDDWKDNKYFLNCVVGPNAGRIKDGILKLSDKTVKLPLNEPTNNLHSGPASIHLSEMEMIYLADDEVSFKLVTEDGRGGYPSEITYFVTYKVEGKMFFIKMGAIPTAETHINMTHHAYYNLTGGREKILNHRLFIDATSVYEVDENNIPSEKVRIEESRFDYHLMQPIRSTVGIDNPFVLSKSESCETVDDVFGNPVLIKRGAIVEYGDRKLTFFSNQEEVVVYTNHHEFQTYRGLCLEFQRLPNSMNLVKAGERYVNTIAFEFE